MPNPGKGGYGKRAPYETVHYRIPKPIKPVVQMLANRFRQLVGGGVSDHQGKDLIKRVEDAIVGEVSQENINLYNIQLDSQAARKDVEGDEDLDDEIDTDEDDDGSEPTHAEVEKRQAEINHSLILEVKMLDREIAELKARLQSADEAIFQYQFTSDMTKAKVGEAKIMLGEFLSKQTRESKAMKAKIEEALKLIDSI